jgi:hypothetical protein
MQTDKWGPHAWEYLHTVTFAYPEEPSAIDKQDYYDLFSNLRTTLPCKHCRDSYSIFFKHIPIDNYLDSRYGLVFWLYVIHNMVNLKLNKDTVSFKDVIIKYENLRARCGKVNDKAVLEKCRAELPPIPDSKILELCDKCFFKYQDITAKYIVNLVKSGENPIKI